MPGGRRAGLWVVLVAVPLLVLAACSVWPGGSADSGGAASTSAPTGDDCAGTAPVSETGVAYVDEPAAGQWLDLTVPARPDECATVPVVVWVHGGGWALGTRAGPGTDRKRQLFTEAGWAFVSVGYRLSPSPPDPEDEDRTTHPTHVEDVAAAIAWVVEHGAEHGIDTSRIGLMGHSAGAHLVSLVGTDGSYLGDAGSSIDHVRCVASLDTEAYQIGHLASRDDPALATTYRNAFTDDPDVWQEASPVEHVDGDEPARWLVVTRGRDVRQDVSSDFAAQLEDEGADAQVLTVDGLNHAEVSRRVGMAGDTTITPPLLDFFSACFESSGPDPSG